MVLPILVPPAICWHPPDNASADIRRQFFTAKRSRNRRKVRKLCLSTPGLRRALIAHWLPVAKRCVPPPLATLIHRARADTCPRTVLRQCEAMLRQLLRRRRRALGLTHGELTRLAASFDGNTLRAAPSSSAPALAFVLASMHWFGCSHPRSLFMAPMHPPTGLIRWMTHFTVQEQVDQGQQLPERLSLEVRRIECFANALVTQILAMTPRHSRGAVLLPELLKIAESDDLNESGSFTTLPDQKSMTYVDLPHRPGLS